MLDDVTLLLSFNNNNKNIHKTNNLPVFDYVLVVSLIVFRARRREEYPGFFMCSTHTHTHFVVSFLAKNVFVLGLDDAMVCR